MCVKGGAPSETSWESVASCLIYVDVRNFDLTPLTSQRFGKIEMININISGAAQRQQQIPAGVAAGAAGSAAAGGVATVMITFADAKTALDVCDAYNGEWLCGSKIEVCLAAENPPPCCYQEAALRREHHSTWWHNGSS